MKSEIDASIESAIAKHEREAELARYARTTELFKVFTLILSGLLIGFCICMALWTSGVLTK